MVEEPSVSSTSIGTTGVDTTGPQGSESGGSSGESTTSLDSTGQGSEDVSEETGSQDPSADCLDVVGGPVDPITTAIGNAYFLGFSLVVEHTWARPEVDRVLRISQATACRIADDGQTVELVFDAEVCSEPAGTLSVTVNPTVKGADAADAYQVVEAHHVTHSGQRFHIVEDQYFSPEETAWTMYLLESGGKGDCLPPTQDESELHKLYADLEAYPDYFASFYLAWLEQLYHPEMSFMLDLTNMTLLGLNGYGEPMISYDVDLCGERKGSVVMTIDEEAYDVLEIEFDLAGTDGTLDIWQSLISGNLEPEEARLELVGYAHGLAPGCVPELDEY